MSNLHRGEVSLPLGGERLVLRLTLQALAEIEAAFGVTDLQALGEKLGQGRIGARDLMILIGAAARGGGNSLDDASLGARISAAELPEVVAALGQLFALTFGEAPPKPAKSRPPKPPMR